ncbi:hypothetical protein WOLCODRAFT_136847 [Wolfiporia cocos MD-104 SS10]|uniref:Uncharacterized protein n=1 Tax=Wolfiporia cocos (strain MD-104) TaxID=742152 RepID=A0A2H3JDW2_WOLCO|nr:hypothetical protein WOLCODRAFT_136847 [Wolfiporia cocos MD-104 SS10]
MDYDRRSAVSSFYGGRKSSDALNADFPPGAAPPRRPAVDSASSFYGPDRASRAGSAMLGRPGAGYNRSSYFYAGREEPVKGGVDEESMLSQRNDNFDIYADFNNQGPRYSNVLVNDNGYRPVPEPAPTKEYQPATPNQVELVTVPALGPEWKASEMRDMTKAAKRERAMESFAEKWNAWNRGERGLCGQHFTRRTVVYILFGLCVAIGLVLAFTIPRVPDISFPSSNPLSKATEPFNETVPVIFSRSPANFSFPAQVGLEIDTNSNYLPLIISKMEATVTDLTTGAQVATGSRGKTTLPAKAFPVIQIPLNFTYIAPNDSDITWLDYYDACRNPAANANNSRPVLQFNLDFDMWIVGLVGKRSNSATVTEAECPITLSLSAV